MPSCLALTWRTSTSRTQPSSGPLAAVCESGDGRHSRNGVVDFGLVFEALEHVGYTGWLVMADFSGVRPSREALRYNLQFVRSFIGSS